MGVRLVACAGAICCSVLIPLPGLVLAQHSSDAASDHGSGRSAAADEQPQVQEAEEEYQDDQRPFGTNLDAVARLNENLPKSESLLRWSLPEGVSEWKGHLYASHGLKLGVSYQSLFQKASTSLTDKDSAWGGWFLFHAAWTAANRGRDLQGTLVVALDGRHVIDPSSNAAPGLFSNDIGSVWPTDAAYFEWDVYSAVLFWEQWATWDRLAIRVGQQTALSALNEFRFDELKTSFTSSAMAAPVAVIPVGPPGLGVAAKWWPMVDSELYVRAIVNDINAPAGQLDWSGIFDTGDVFAGAEIGYSWVRAEDDFDHAHLTLWYADEVSTAPFVTESGWGFKMLGSKQWGPVVGFGSYAYNNAVGGGFGMTRVGRAVNAGLAYLKPLDIRGEVAIAGSLARPIDEDLRDQSGVEAYWKILVMSNFWTTPGVQYLINPSLNPETDSILLAQIKISAFF